ncbi:MAG: heme NO-binding domain-containing protein [Flavobacteriales bacterium]
MKGVVFTEFLEMVEQRFGMEMVNSLLEENNLSSGGVYSALGTYHHGEMVTLVVDLGKRSGMDVPDLLKAFGGYLFNTFKSGYPEMFASANNGFEFLQSVDQEIHVEVLKLYPDAELPSFKTELLEEHVLQMDYRSDRAMGALALGLIEACGNHFNEGYEVDYQPQTEDGKYVRFVITRNA